MRITDWSGGQDDLEAELVGSAESPLVAADLLLGDDPKLHVPREEYEDTVELLVAVDLLPGDFLVLGVQLRQQTLMDCTAVLEESH